MWSRARFLAGVALFACGGSDSADVGWSGFEICNNGLDDNGDGLVDCEDVACAGPACRLPPTDTSPTVQGIVIEYEPGECDFRFSANDCTMLICSIDVPNGTDGEALVNASCENPSGGASHDNVVDLRNAQQLGGRVGALVDSPLDANDTGEIELYYDCFTLQSFEATCTLEVKTSEHEATETIVIEGQSV